jgi:pyruvate dehydrogenase E1 component alpha subunit/2-oxoisovalerate dehydrogenase E1 component alpha subunit
MGWSLPDPEAKLKGQEEGVRESIRPARLSPLLRRRAGTGYKRRMVQSLASPDAGCSAPASREIYLEAFRWMLLARALEEKFASLYRGGKIHGGVFLGKGQEALSVSIGLALKPGDVFAPLIRDTAGRLAFGEPLLDGVRSYLGSALGPMRGRDGNVHRGRPREGLLAMISHLGAMISVVNGMLFAKRMKGQKDFVGVASIGDGATSTGSFHEAINQAAVEKLPLVLVVANNQYAYSTPNDRQFACRKLVDKALGYGVAGHSLDGTRLADCLSQVAAVVERARSGHGPQLIEARLLRLCGHGEHDDGNYVDAKLKSSAVGRDCLLSAEEEMCRAGWADAASLQRWRHEVTESVEQAVAKVQREPAPDPFQEEWRALTSQNLVEGMAASASPQ